MTEEQQGGTAPQPEASASGDQASEQPVAAIAVADEPATDETTETQATATESAVDADPAPEAGATDTAGSTNGVVDAAAATIDAEASTADPTARAAAAPDTTPASPSDDATDGAAMEPESAAVTDADPPTSTAPESETAAAETATAGADAEPAAADEAAPVSLLEQEPAIPAPRPELGPEPTTMEELLAEQESDIKSFKHGDVVEGKVVRIDKDEILVDIGAKSEGVVSNRELYGKHAEAQPQLTIGDVVLVYVLQPESQEGHVVLSLRRAGLERKWRAMQEQFEAGVIIEAPVIDHNKGGLIVDCGIRGFVPISQIVDFPRRPQNDQPRDAAQEIAEKLQPFVGRKLRLKILEVNRKANRLILSEKVALYEERREKRDELFSSLQVGQKVKGTVRSIAPFGVFIDLGGIDGLVHKSELSWNKVNNPEAGYKVGDEVEAEVIDINHERGRISLSIRRLQPDPWNSTVADFNVGDVIDGTVTKLVNFGAFVRVREGLEGLIHISELSHQRVAHPGDVVHEGQQLKLKIISLDSDRHRLGLSLKQAEEAPVRAMPEPGQAAPAAPRGERRPRQERGWSASDAIQEPEGGIDNTLAAAFAQVREQVAASEAAATVDDEPAPTAEVAAAEPVVEAVAAETAPEPEGTTVTAAEAPVADEEPSATPTAGATPEADTSEPMEAAASEPADATGADTIIAGEPETAAAAEPEAEAAEAPAAEAPAAEAPEAEAPEAATAEAEAPPPEEAAEAADAEPASVAEEDSNKDA